MTGKNIITQQLQSGNVSMPSVSGALKESGAVSFDLTSIQEHTRETSGSSSEETETGLKKKENTVKGAYSTGEKPETNVHQQKKQAMTRKSKLKQQLQTSKVNMPCVSGALKESGTVRIVHASIHERPKKTRGSLTKEKKAVEKKKRNTDKVEFDKEEQTEKNRQPRGNLQQEMSDVAGKYLLKQKLQTSNLSMPSASGALKNSGAVNFVLVTIHEHPKEAGGSPSEERETGRNDYQVATNTKEEPENLANIPEEELEETHL